MILRVSGFFLMLGVVLGALVVGAQAEDLRASGGMLSWPQEEMDHALGIFVPQRMKELNVPGVSIAIVVDDAIAYSGTFGRANRRTAKPVTPATLFKAGELGEAVAAYGAMTMVGDKLLFLDAPLARDLPQPWFANEDDNRLVTLRQVLTHTSGLADNVEHPSRATRFAPGSRFYHSGVGFLYLQHVMEVIAGEPFDVLMKERVFAPLDMRVSRYVAPDGDQARVARGYVPLGFPLSVFYIPFGIAFAIIFVILWAVSRFMLDRRVEPADLLWPALGGLGFTAAIIWWDLGLEHGVYVAAISLICFAAFIVVAAAVYYLLYLMGIARSREGVLSRGRARPEGLMMVIACVIAMAGAASALGWVLPVPYIAFLHGKERANASASFQTNAQDMGRFMIEVMDGEKLGRELHARMLSERVAVGGPFSWALGLGVRTSEGHETLWTRGSAMGFESLMVMDPARRVGIVVLTNSRAGGELAQDIARNVLGIEAVWSLP